MIEERALSLQGMLGSSKTPVKIRKGDESEASYRRRQDFASSGTIGFRINAEWAPVNSTSQKQKRPSLHLRQHEIEIRKSIGPAQKRGSFVACTF